MNIDNFSNEEDVVLNDFSFGEDNDLEPNVNSLEQKTFVAFINSLHLYLKKATSPFIYKVARKTLFLSATFHELRFKHLFDHLVKKYNLESKQPITNSSIDKIKQINHFTVDEIEQWLFGGNSDPRFPQSILAAKQNNQRLQKNYGPKISFSKVEMSGKGKYSSRIGIYSGSITDLYAETNQKVSIGSSNNGDLLIGCGYAVATAIANAAGPGLQAELYNFYGVSAVMDQPAYGKENYPNTEGRGYALTCSSHDMKQTHNIDNIELLTVPMYSLEGLRNMYREAFLHSADKDFIALPLAGMTHPILANNPELSAQVATEEFRKFVDLHPESTLKVIFTIYHEPQFERDYQEAIKALEY